MAESYFTGVIPALAMKPQGFFEDLRTRRTAAHNRISIGRLVNLITDIVDLDHRSQNVIVDSNGRVYEELGGRSIRTDIAQDEGIEEGESNR